MVIESEETLSDRMKIVHENSSNSTWKVPYSMLDDSGVEKVTELGVKFDSDKKLRYSLVPMAEFQEVIEVLTKGSEKYADDNWKFVEGGRNRYYDAMMRHIYAYHLVSKDDPETDNSHLAHVICNALFLMWMDNNPKGEK